jgi:hypothetical protein
LVDTAAGKWKDGGHGTGIFPLTAEDDDEEEVAGDDRSDSSWQLSDTYSAISSDSQDDEATHYAGMDKEKEQSWLSKKTEGLTPAGIRKQLLRKTVR